MPAQLLDNIRAVFFDVGNTLTFPDWKRISEIAVRAGARAYHQSELHNRMCEILRQVDSDQGFLKDLASRKIPRNWAYRRLYNECGLDESQMEALLGALEAEHSERHLWADLNKEALPVLQMLRSRGLLTAAISNTEDGQVERLLRSLGIADYLNLVVDSYLVGFTKPDPGIFLYAVDALGVEADQTLYIGDSYTQDVMGARQAGLRSVLFDPFDLQPQLEATRIRSVRELID